MRGRWLPVMGHCAVFACPEDSSLTPSRPTLVKWILSLLLCCWTSKHSNSSGDNTSGQSVELGPMTLREYINTLEPYDPLVHGWRGDEPLPKRRTPAPQSRVNGVVTSPVKCSYTSVAYRASPRTRSLIV